MSLTLDSLLEKLSGVRKSGSGYMARCPAHEDTNPSLSITEGDRKILLKCQSGCETARVCERLGIEVSDLFLDGAKKKHSKKGGEPVAAYDYTDAAGKLLYQKLRYQNKKFSFRRPAKGGWEDNLDGIKRVLYRLPEVLSNDDILVVEGEKDADTAFNVLKTCATTGGGASDGWLPEFSATLRRKNVVVIADTDEPGRKKAKLIATSAYGSAASVRLCEMPEGKDLTEWVERGGTRENFLAFIAGVSEWRPIEIDPAALLDSIEAFIRRFVSLSQSQARVAALWIIHTYVVACSDTTPYLAITSPEKRSGKTRLLEVFETLAANPWLTGRVTAAVLSRKIDAEQPTLLLDESDAAFNGEKEYAEVLRGVLNTGHRKNGSTSCCVGQGANIGYKNFSTFSPKAIAGIEKLPDTVADRAIPIRLKRAARGDCVERFRLRNVAPEAASLRDRIETWAALIAESLTTAMPQLPETLNDRQQDGAEPLLAIADAARGEWPLNSRVALVELCSGPQASDESISVKLLSDIRATFQERGVDEISSADLVAALAEIETSPWVEWSHGKPLTAPKLARLLSKYRIAPGNIRFGEKVLRGYEKRTFADAWGRYLSPLDNAQVPENSPSNCYSATTRINTSQNSDFESATGSSCSTSQNTQIACKDAPCSSVALSKVESGSMKQTGEEEDF